MSFSGHEIGNQSPITPQSFTVPELVEILKTVKAPALERALDATKRGVASDADWTKFFAAISTVDAPAIALSETEGNKQVVKRRAPRVVKGAQVVAAILLVLEIADRLWTTFKDFDDKEGRSKWTQEVVSDSWNEDSTWNYVVVYTQHTVRFNGRRDVDWTQRDYQYKLRFGGITYTLYAFRSGIFSLIGDGGYLNWACYGRIVSIDPDWRRPRRVVFSS